MFGKDHVVVSLPSMTDMGSAQRGRSCNIVQMLLDRGGMTEREISDRLVMTVPRAHETIMKMEREGIVTVMMPNGNRLVFLNDKRAWRERLDLVRAETVRG